MKLRRNPIPAVLGLLALGALTCGIREDELRCEEAVAHLVDCCPGFVAAQVDCYYSTGCGTSYPSIDIGRSRCISALKCDQVLANGLCDSPYSGGGCP